jgi:hypothetical protein
LQELAYVSKLKPQATSVLEGDEITFQQQKSDPNKITKLVEEELEQSDLRLENYVQNNHLTLLLKMSDEHVQPWTGYVRSHRIYLVKVLDMSGPP